MVTYHSLQRLQKPDLINEIIILTQRCMDLRAEIAELRAEQRGQEGDKGHERKQT